MKFNFKTLAPLVIYLSLSGCNVAYDTDAIVPTDHSIDAAIDTNTAGDMTVSTTADAGPDLAVTTCILESDDEMCQRLNIDCGNLSQDDNCGDRRWLVNCGSCDSPNAVCRINTCQETDCGNDTDDDGDGDIDCADHDCVNQRCGGTTSRCRPNGECR